MARRHGHHRRLRSAAWRRRGISRTTGGSASASPSSGIHNRQARPSQCQRPADPTSHRSPVPLLKGNLHAHTTFSDGRRPIGEVIARYRDLEYDFLAITDHDDRIFDDYWFNIPLGDDRLLILPGVEIDYRPLSQHVGKVMGDRETLYVLNHPARYGLPVEEAVRRNRVIH